MKFNTCHPHKCTYDCPCWSSKKMILLATQDYSIPMKTNKKSKQTNNSADNNNHYYYCCHYTHPSNDKLQHDRPGLTSWTEGTKPRNLSLGPDISPSHFWEWMISLLTGKSLKQYMHLSITSALADWLCVIYDWGFSCVIIRVTFGYFSPYITFNLKAKFTDLQTEEKY